MIIESIKSQDLDGIALGRILGIDYGTRRIGLAVSDPSQLISSTLRTVENDDMKAALLSILQTIREMEIVAVVIGLPINMDGTHGEKAHEVETFIHKLAQKCNLPLISWDERWSTQSAHRLLLEQGKSPSKSRQIIDQMAAAFILQSFLDRLHFLRKNQKITDHPTLP